MTAPWTLLKVFLHKVFLHKETSPQIQTQDHEKKELNATRGNSPLLSCLHELDTDMIHNSKEFSEIKKQPWQLDTFSEENSAQSYNSRLKHNAYVEKLEL